MTPLLKAYVAVIRAGAMLVPAMYNLCLLQPGFASADSSPWRVGGFGGAPMPPSIIERFAAKLPRLSLTNAYGATETTSPATMMPPSETVTRLDSIGYPAPCAEILIMDDLGREVPRGGEGEIRIRGPMVVSGLCWGSSRIGSLELGLWPRIRQYCKAARL